MGKEASYFDRVCFCIVLFIILLELITVVIEGNLWPLKAYFIYRMLRFFVEVCQGFFKKKGDAD